MSKYIYESLEDKYKTPPELYQMALDKWGIDKFNLDTCCSDKHIPAKWYCKYGDIDGLAANWVDYAWCNPPFKVSYKWVEKAYNENKERGINIAMLLPVRTETKFWHDYILHNPNVEIIWLRKGYTFIDPNTNKPVQMNKKQKDGTYKLVNGVYKNALALVYFKGF